jgi:MFS family permease
MKTASSPSSAATPGEGERQLGAVLRRADGRLAASGWIALAVLAVAVFLTALDQTVVITAITSMGKDVGVSDTEPDRLAWIVSGYLLGYVIAMPLMGRVADVFGRRRVLTLCLMLFAVGSLLCATAPSLGAPFAPDYTTTGGAIMTPFYNGANWLITQLGRVGLDTRSPALDILVGARFLQAVGGGALVPVAMAVIGDLFGAQRRGLALGLIGGVTEAGGVLGPLWGAFITANWGWQWIFYINLPVALVLLVVGFFTIPRLRAARERIDLLGAVLFGAALACLTVGLGAQGANAGALDTKTQLHTDVRLLIASGVLLLVFLGVESIVRQPVVKPAMFRRRAFSASAVLSLLIGAALIVSLVEIPLYMATVLNLDPIPAGLALLRMTAFIPVGAVLGGILSNRFSVPTTAAIGVLCTAGGLFLMHFWPVDVGQVQITIATVIAGLGFGLVIAPISTSALNGSERSQAGVAAAIVTALRMTGMILGLAALTAWGLALFRSLVAAIPLPGTPGGPPVNTQTEAAYENALTGAFHTVYTDIFLVAAVIVLIGMVPALLLWRKGKDAGEDIAGLESYVAPLA